MDKAWSAKAALKVLKLSPEETIAFGDSVSDFAMSLGEKIAFAFVGPQEQWKAYEKSGIHANVVFKAKPGHSGPEVVLEILNHIF